MPVLPITQTASDLAPYVPRVVIRELAREPAAGVRELPGTLVFADVAGFTSLSERLARIGPEGAEQLSDAIGTSFASLLEVAYANGGGLLKFGGDALLLFFEGDGHTERACRAAIGMRRTLRAIGAAAVPAVRSSLRVSVGVHCGTVQLFLVGRGHREAVLAGPAVSTVLRMEHAAGAGEIVVSPAVAERLTARAVGAATGPGRLLLAAPGSGDRAPDEDPVDADPAQVAAALPTAVREHLLGGGSAPEHRLVTIAFVRFAGTDARIARDAGAAARDLEELVGCVQDAAETYGVALLGSDVDVDGGKFLLCGGAPRAVGDEEERMLRALRAIADAGTHLPVHIGAHSGRAFTGDIGPDYRRTYTAMGDVVNLAARLMGKAPAGGIYATGGVLDRAATPFARTALAPLELKGKARPVEAWAVGRPTPRTSSARAGSVDGGALAGREAELATLRKALAAVRGGEGRYVEVSGAPGIGKTRLLEAVRRDAAGLPVFLATCEGQGGGSPYAPWRELLIELVGGSWEEPADTVLARLRTAVAERAPDLAPWLPLLAVPFGIATGDTPEVARLAPTFRAERLHRTVIRFLEASLPDPAVLVIEHAHDMDAASAALLAAVLDGALPGDPWLVVTSRRDTAGGFEADPGVARTFLRLEPLPPAEALQLAERLTDGAPLPPWVVSAAVERAAGNPQFLRDLLATAAAGGDGLSDTLEAAATARIDRLAPHDRALVRRASVLGMSFHPRMLADVLEGAPQPDGRAWHRLRDVFADDGDGWYRFRIGVIRDAAYAGLPFRTRRRLHAAAAARLERELQGDASARAAALSLHFFQAGDHAGAWRYGLLAGRQARDRGAHADAAQYFTRAAASARGAAVAPAELAEVLVELGEAHARSGQPEAAHGAYRRARKLVADDPVRVGEVLLRETELADRAGEARHAVRTALRALRVLDGIRGGGAARCRARLLAALALTRQRQGRCDDAVRLCAQAIAEGEAAHEERAIAHACHLLDWALHDAGRGAEATHSTRALAIYERLGDLDRQAAVLNNLGAFAFHAGDWREAVVLYRRAGNASEQAGDVVNAAFGDCNVGEVLVEQGRLTAADETLRRAIRVWRGCGYESGAAYATALLGRAAVHQGRSEHGRGLVQRALAKLRRLGHEPEAQMAEALLAEALVFGGHPERALQDIEALTPRLLDARLEPLLARLRGCALAQLDEPAAAIAAVTLSLERAGALGVAYDAAAALHVLAALDGTDPRAPERRRESKAILERLGVVRLATPPLS
jgi:class 3 adenylate cyclase/tetratricopeptide (TPR) repeat protein